MRERRHLGGRCGWIHVIGVLLCVAVVANGATFWLKRTGWLEPDAYHAHRVQKSNFRVSSRLDPAYAEVQSFHRREMRRLYAVSGAQTITKLVKYGLVVLIVGVSLWVGWRAGYRPVVSRQPLLLGFTASVVLAALVSWLRFGGLLLVPGLRLFAFVAVPLSVTHLASTRSLALLSNYLIGLVYLQLILTIPEITRGLDIFSGTGLLPVPGDRVTGAFLQPTTLGLFCVIALLFYVCFGNPPPRMRFVTVVAGGIVVIAAGSASALLLFLLVIGYAYAPEGGRWCRCRWRLPVFVVIGLMMLLALPWLTARPDVFASMFGRVLWMQRYFSEATGPMTVLFGEGLGIGTNVAVHWFRYAMEHGAEVPLSALRGGSNSTAQCLVSQIGVVGCVGFYALLAHGAWSDTRARPVYVVIGIASLTTNVIEFFPVNVLLGLLLAHSAATVQGSLLPNQKKSNTRL